MAKAKYCMITCQWMHKILMLSMILISSSGKRSSHVVNQNSPAMRRILSEWKTVQAEGLAMGEGHGSVKGNSSDTFRLKPVGNMFEWHFTFLGAKNTPFEGGLYHGSISLPANYPRSGPSVRLLNKNQRFKVGSRICLSASEYHQETWQPTWTVTSLVSALVAHMTEPAVEIGSIQGATPSQKRAAAASSRSFECPTCGVWHGSFPKEIFPTPPGFIASKKRTPPLDKDIVGGRDTGNRQHSGVKEMQAVDRSALQEGSSLSRIVRLLASKSFLLMLALILASYFLKQTR